MSTYVIGDVQGCLDGLRRLLELCAFDPGSDRLVLTGDLVARGSASLETLRFVRALGTAAISVLGNHDLHLLAALYGHADADASLQAILAADDRDILRDWLRNLPLTWHDPTHNVLVIHAGLPPQWHIADAQHAASRVEATLRDVDALQAFLPQMYGNQPTQWRDDLDAVEAQRFTINCLTRARYCSADGSFEFRSKGTPGTQPEVLLPWFSAPNRCSIGTTIIFGHWSTLGQITWPQWNVVGLDTGYVWGGAMTALRLEDRCLFQVTSRTE
ncbi:symmetrical bis(5'-nucleosyl)-tetraphosphatase [Sinimarinibacterium sp. CAU 1509]|uniref:symmetrical bis(5'-nucleosyl)-tetraphosphatase n=1 Tax=Sinimarinibacterium sp. CAU 1509 TaxID=2562283 RepID=UPI0010AD97C6|nr:symmetrical bis(5'-nucleosyl)-tetraphosphatase [Sinimarinibacterium sp. CAU 1509]TJY56716.1 symmetrical bis(5'-nucleosyl)-tetraphosphatase [Sinimarinibacterium sp. CAU 1509]